MKVGQAARMAIEAARRGEKPVLTVANTMETFLKDFVADTGGATGDVIDADFSAVLTKYLKRVRTILIKDSENPRGQADPLLPHDEDLGPAALPPTGRRPTLRSTGSTSPTSPFRRSTT
jgi:hypothetical protein